MYPIPLDLDLDCLIGQDLVSISIGRYSMHLYFDRPSTNFPTPRPAEIYCGGTVLVDFEGSTTLMLDTYPGCLVGATVEDKVAWRDASKLPILVGESVVAWSIEGSHEFSITLSNRAKLRFQSHDSPYEEFTIFGSRWII